MAARNKPEASSMTLAKALELAGNDGRRLWVQEDTSIIIMNPGVRHTFRRQRTPRNEKGATGTGMPPAPRGRGKRVA